MGHCNDRGVSDPSPADCWTTGGAISVPHRLPEVHLGLGAPASVCAVFFWPGGEAAGSPAASLVQAYSDRIVTATHSGTRALGVWSDIDLLALAQLVYKYRSQNTPWVPALKPRAVLVVPDDAMPGHARPHGHVFRERVIVHATLEAL